MLFRTLSILLALCQTGLAIAAVDPVESKILARVDAEQPRALALLERAVNINSGTMNFVGVRQVGELFKQEFVELGFDVQWIEGEPFSRAGHLVASHGDRGPKILLIGHLDTVFATDSEFQRFEVLEGNRGRGPGASDMKGGNVVMLHALRALKAAGVLDDISVRVVMTGDEENRGSPYDLANAALVEAAVWADIALGFEDGDGDPRTAVIARRGASEWRLTVTGTPAHSSQIFREDLGYGAIFEAARILEGFRVALSGVNMLTFNPGVIAGGTEVSLDKDSSNGTVFGKENVIARSAVVLGDIRALSPQQLAEAKQVMQGIVDESPVHTSATIEFWDPYPPLAPTEGNHRLLQLYSRVSQDLGFGPVAAVDPRKAGAADVSFAAEHIEMALDGLGLMGTGGHTVQETADLATLASQTKRAAILMYRLGIQGK